MKKTEVKRIIKVWGVDVSQFTTEKELLNAFEFATYKVCTDEDDDSVRYIETASGDLIIYELDGDTLMRVYLG